MQRPTERYDERDHVFARRDLVSGTPEYEEFYQVHTHWKAADDAFRAQPEIGRRIHPADLGFFEAPARIMHHLGRPEIVDGDPVAEPIPLSAARATEKIKSFAYRLGADLVGISKLHSAFVYSHRGRIKYAEEPWGAAIECRHHYAVSLGFREDIGLIRTAPHPGELFETARSYLRSAVVSVVLAQYIRDLGYPARAHHFRNYQVLSVPLAVEAGLGELARCGFLLTKQFGNCLRLSTVTTDLPLIVDQPVDIGVQDFCRRCKLCAEACPSKAIPFGEKVPVRGVLKWCIDPLKCYPYWSKAGTDCGICIASCPWSQPDVWYHRTAASWASRSVWGRVVLLWLYPILYGKYRPHPSPSWIEPGPGKTH